MCRLCLLTATNIGPEVKKEIAHETLMRASHGDAGQRDGWGVTDGRRITRSVNWYFEDVPTWKHELFGDGFLLGHLRKASAGTRRTVAECHPYTFETNHGPLIAAHNGYFDGGRYTGWSNDMPGTDSYRALNQLALLINEQGVAELKPEIITDWLSTFYDTSHYAVMLLWRDRAYVVRGRTRPLSALRVGNGYLFHTDATVTKFMQDYIRAMYPSIEVGDAVQHVRDDIMISLSLGSPYVDMHVLKIEHTKRQYTQTVWETNPKTPAVTTAGNQLVRVGEVNDAATPRIYTVAPSVTKPRANAGTAVPVLTPQAAPIVR